MTNQITEANAKELEAGEYRKTATIRATQWFKMGDHPAVVLKSAPNRYADEGIPWCPTLEGGHVVTPGDWIATGVQGEHWPIKPDVFAATYERVVIPAPAAVEGSSSSDGEFHRQIDILRRAAAVPVPDDDSDFTPDVARRSAESWRSISSNLIAAYAALQPSSAADAKPVDEDFDEQARIDYLRASRDSAADRAHTLYRALVEVRDCVETYPLDDSQTCMCGSPVEGHNIGSGHAPVSQADHAISLIVEAIDKALGVAAIPNDALIGAGRPDDYEGPDVGMHDTEIVEDDND